MREDAARVHGARVPRLHLRGRMRALIGGTHSIFHLCCPDVLQPEWPSSTALPSFLPSSLCSFLPFPPPPSLPSTFPSFIPFSLPPSLLPSLLPPFLPSSFPLSLFASLPPSFLQQTLPQHLLCAKNCARCRGECLNRADKVPDLVLLLFK